MLYKQPGSKYYWCKFQWNGDTIRRPTKASDKRTARQVESKIRSELALENYGILQPKTEGPNFRSFSGRVSFLLLKHASKSSQRRRSISAGSGAASFVPTGRPKIR